MSDLPPGWEWTTLGDLAAPEPRAITDGPFGSNLKSNHYTNSGARVIRLQNIGDGEFRDERAFIDLHRFEQLKAHEARAGDLVVASLGDAPPRACLVPELHAVAIVKADCIRVRLSEHVLPDWILYALLSPPTKAYAKSLIKGVGRPRIGLGLIRNFRIPVPPLAEQRRIVDHLDATLSQLVHATQSLRSAQQKVSVGVASIRHSIAWRRDEDTHTGILADIVDKIEAGRSFGSATRPAAPHEWGIVKVSAMTWGTFQEAENKYVDADAVDARYEIQPGDILVSRANTEAYVGAPVLVGEVRPRLLLSDKSLRLIPKAGVDRNWLLHVLASPATRRYMSRVATGTKDSMRNISQAALLQAPVVIASKDEQRRIAAEIDDRLADVFRLEQAVNSAYKQAEELRRSLLADAFAGRLVPQDPADEPASMLLERIRSERSVATETTRRRRSQ